jgi:tetratricopeptide (TPR) repeat protein
LHWGGTYQNANMMCISCHTTNFQKNYDGKKESYTSTWSQMNVSCEACHGPGEHHLNWAKAKAAGKKERELSGEHLGLQVDFKHGGANTIIETCGLCHSHRSEFGAHSKISEPLMNNYLPTLLSADLYYPDGQQQGEVYVYNSFRQSKMYQMGVSCIDCHHPHTGKLKYAGNAVCTECHNPQGDKRFPTAAKLYDDPLHTFHRKGSTGSYCVNCHMPAKKYMIIHARRDHSIRIPRPDLSMKLGTPNACTGCHTDKTANWASEQIKNWYGVKQNKIHYGEIIAAGRKGQKDAEAGLVKLARDLSEPTVVRATALDLLSYYGLASINASLLGARNKDPAMRLASIAGLEKLYYDERLKQVSPFLKDPIRAVRIEAARVLLDVPPNLFNADERVNFNIALNELIAVEQNAIGMPSANLNLGAIYERLEKFKQAEIYYRKALHIDPHFIPARLNLARMLNSMNRNREAEKILREGIHLDRDQGEFHYSLGLLLTEENRLQEAAHFLKRAAELLPSNARVHYHYALILQQLALANSRR